MAKNWLEKMKDGFKGKTSGVILTFNLFDYVLVPGRPPCRLKTFLSQYLKTDEGYDLVIHFSRAKGCELYDDYSNREHSQEMRSDFERYSGLCLQSGENGQSQQTARDELKLTLSGLTKLLRQKKIKVALIIDYAHHLAPASQGMPFPPPEYLTAVETIHSWGIDDRIRATDNRIILLAFEGHINEALRSDGSGYKVIEVDLPNEDDRLRFCRLLLDRPGQGRQEFAQLEEGLSPESLARLTSGLRYTDLEDLFRSASVTESRVGKKIVRESKAEVVSSSNLMVT